LYKSVILYFDTSDRVLGQHGWQAQVTVKQNNVDLTFNRVYNRVKKVNQTSNEVVRSILNSANSQGFNDDNKEGSEFKPSVFIMSNKVVVTFALDRYDIVNKTDEIREFARIQRFKTISKASASTKRVAIEKFLSKFILDRMPKFMLKKLNVGHKELKLRVKNENITKMYTGKIKKGNRDSLKLYVSSNKGKRHAVLKYYSFSEKSVNKRIQDIAGLLKPEWIGGDI